MTNYTIKKAKGDTNNILTYDDMKNLGHYIEETEYNIIYERTMKALKNQYNSSPFYIS